MPDDDERNLIVATLIKCGRCPFGQLVPTQTIAQCPLGFPGCACGDELMLNPYLEGEPKPAHESFEKFVLYCNKHAANIFVRHNGRTMELSKVPKIDRSLFIERWWRERIQP